MYLARGGSVSYRNDSTKSAGQADNVSKTSENTTSAVLVGGLVKALEGRARDRATRVLEVELVKHLIDASVECLSLSRGVLVLLGLVLLRLLVTLALVLGLLLVTLGLVLLSLLVTLALGLLVSLLGGDSSGENGNGSEGELHFDGSIRNE